LNGENITFTFKSLQYLLIIDDLELHKTMIQFFLLIL